MFDKKSEFIVMDDVLNKMMNLPGKKGVQIAFIGLVRSEWSFYSEDLNA